VAEQALVTHPVLHVPADVLGARLADELATGSRFVMLVGLDGARWGATGWPWRPWRPPRRLARAARAAVPLDAAALPVGHAAGPGRPLGRARGARPAGDRAGRHPDPRRLVLHERWPRGYHPLRKDVPGSVRPPDGERRFVPFEVHGEGVYQLPVGPIHAGVIEPGHFRFSAMGERVLHLDARLFFVHRGLEKLAEGRHWPPRRRSWGACCGVCSVTHASPMPRAWRRSPAPRRPARARWARVLLAELERLYNHVGDLGNICAGIGFTSGVSRLGWLKERLVRANDALTGHRYLAGIVAPGGLASELDPAGLAALPSTLEAVGAELAAAVRAIVRSEGVMSRLHGAGVVSPETAAALGALGIAARATGLRVDLRHDAPYAAYDELEVGVVTAAAGDVAARFHVRAQEAQASLRLLAEALGACRPDP